jgi:hypothetical protein
MADMDENYLSRDGAYASDLSNLSPEAHDSDIASTSAGHRILTILGPVCHPKASRGVSRGHSIITQFPIARERHCNGSYLDSKTGGSPITKTCGLSGTFFPTWKSNA